MTKEVRFIDRTTKLIQSAPCLVNNGLLKSFDHYHRVETTVWIYTHHLFQRIRPIYIFKIPKLTPVIVEKDSKPQMVLDLWVAVVLLLDLLDFALRAVNIFESNLSIFVLIAWQFLAVPVLCPFENRNQLARVDKTESIDRLAEISYRKMRRG